MQTEVLLELRTLNESLKNITIALKAIASKGEMCTTCRFFHTSDCTLENSERSDNACLDWEPGRRTHD